MTTGVLINDFLNKEIMKRETLANNKDCVSLKQKMKQCLLRTMKTAAILERNQG